MNAKKYHDLEHEKSRGYVQKWRDNNKEKAREQVRKSTIKTLYGISLVKYIRIFNKQNGCCKICGTHQDKLSKLLAVDHNHETGEIRSLLCNACNIVLGSAFEDINILKSAIDYCEEWKMESIKRSEIIVSKITQPKGFFD